MPEKELLLGEDNKFTLDFSNKEFVQEIKFSSKTDYYITSLNCNLVVKEHIEYRKRLIEELSQKSRLLLEKGPAYQNNIDQIEYRINGVGLIPWKDYFKFFLLMETLNLTWWKYEYYVVIEKKLNLVKLIRHTRIFLLEALLSRTTLLIIMIITTLDLMKQTI